jgi:hypothetical protein
MKRHIPFAFFTILVFLIVLIPIGILLLNLPGIITWVSRSSFFGGNALVLVALIPLLSGVLLCVGLGIITKREEKYTLEDHEQMKKENPAGDFGENDLENISTLIDAIGLSLDHIKSRSEEILSLSKTITRASQNMDIKKPLPPAFPLCTDKFLEMPVTPEALTMAMAKIYQTEQTEEQKTFKPNKCSFKKPISEKEVLHMLLARLRIERDFHISR